MRDLRELDRHREHAFEERLGIALREADRRYAGVFRIPIRTARKPLLVIVSSGDHPQGMGWDHVSASLPARCPTWDEMEHVKGLFFLPHEVAMQLHVPAEQHISNHSYCLHLWRPVDQQIPQPPPFMVGIRELGDLTRRVRA